jgi:hypothetical protein
MTVTDPTGAAAGPSPPRLGRPPSQAWTQRVVRRLTGLCGMAAGVLGTALGPLYFMYSGAPPTWNVLTRSLLNMLAVGSVIVFLAGLRALIRDANAAYEWVASLVFDAGVYAAINMVKISLEAGIDRLVTALLLAAAGYAILRTRVLPSWAGTSAYMLAVVNLAFVPSLYFGIDAARFYSALGWGNTALTAGLFLYWAAAVGLAALVQAKRATLPAR